MWSLETIKRLNNEACERQARKNDDMLLPAVIETEEDILPENLRVPMLCEEGCDAVQLEELAVVMVEHSVWGAPHERADTQEQFLDRLRRMLKEHGPLAVGMESASQFQGHVRIWKATE